MEGETGTLELEDDDAEDDDEDEDDDDDEAPVAEELELETVEVAADLAVQTPPAALLTLEATEAIGLVTEPEFLVKP